jgi:cobalamin biosynthesis Mg chelatase CobN
MITITKQDLENTDLNPGQIKHLLHNYYEQQQDLKLLKDTIFDLLKKLGLVNEDGTFREKINMKDLLSIATMAMTQADKLKKEFGFVLALEPLISRYKSL